MSFRKTILAVAVLASSAISMPTHAQIAGSQPLSVTVEQSQALLTGWSVKKSVLDKAVYNDDGSKIGVIRDLIVAPDGSVSAAIVAAGGFLGLAAHDVAVPIVSLDVRDGNLSPWHNQGSASGDACIRVREDPDAAEAEARRRQEEVRLLRCRDSAPDQAAWLTRSYGADAG